MFVLVDTEEGLDVTLSAPGDKFLCPDDTVNDIILKLTCVLLAAINGIRLDSRKSTPNHSQNTLAKNKIPLLIHGVCHVMSGNSIHLS